MSYRFRELREKAGLTTAELAKRIGVSQAAASQWDTGKKFPSSETLCNTIFKLKSLFQFERHRLTALSILLFLQ